MKGKRNYPGGYSRGCSVAKDIISKSCAVILLLLLIIPQTNSEEDEVLTDEIWVTSVQDTINPMISEYLNELIVNADNANIRCLIIELDTPGGLLESTRAIVQEIMNSQVPIIVYVSPEGARAASAGMFITISAHIAAMAPATNIGAAHPVSIGTDLPGTQKSLEEEEDSVEGVSNEQRDVMSQKIMNDSLAWARGIAERRDRNVEWVESAIIDSVSSTEKEALETGVIDLIANNRQDLIIAINGKEIELANRTIILDLESAEIIPKSMTLRQKFLSTIINPTIAVYLMVAGLIGLYIELTHPGLILPGVIGGISLILALFAMHTLPINYAGLLLMLLAIAFFVGEVKIPSYGILTIGGIVAFVLGATMLIDSELPGMEVSFIAIVPLAIAFGLISVFLLTLIVKSHARKTSTGDTGMIGRRCIIDKELNPEGQIFIRGETWIVRSKDGSHIPANTEIEVIAVEGLKLIIQPIDLNN